MKTIAIANQKGGVGKTTTTINLGIGLAMQGKKVLLVDCDPQGNLTEGMGFYPADKYEETIANVFTNIIFNNEFDQNFGILHHAENVDLLPANIELSGIATMLVDLKQREVVLRKYINQVKESYDYILIDCTPSLGMLTLNALAAADSVIIPVEAQYLPVRGLEQLLRTINKTKQKINPKLEIEGIVMTKVDYRTNFGKDIVELIRKSYGNNIKIFSNSIPVSIRVAEATVGGQSIYTYDKRNKAASAYRAFTKEVLDNEKSRKRNKNDIVR